MAPMSLTPPQPGAEETTNGLGCSYISASKHFCKDRPKEISVNNYYLFYL